MKGKHIIPLVLACCVWAFALGLSEPALAPEWDAPAPYLAEPTVAEDSALSTGQVTTWTCVTFGAYPQTEIVPEPSGAVDAYAVREGDCLADPVLYEGLARAEWKDGEAAIDGVRYLRVGRDGASGGAPDSPGHYRKNEGDEWHYFRYDPIVWRVIALEEGKALLLADMLLDCLPYHTEACPVNWEGSTLRSWLNGLPGSENAAGADYRGKGFLDRAFTDSERDAILPARVENRPNPLYGTDCGNDTEDYVFLLANDDVFGTADAARHGFFPTNGKDDPAKRFRSTMYAKFMGAWWSPVDGYLGNSFWFMRTNGYTRESVTYICDFGYIYQRGTVPTCGDAGILPAIWIDTGLEQYAPAGTRTSRDILAGASSDGAEGGKTKDLVANPVVAPDADQPDGKTVTYSLVRFGSYPQTEVADPALYAALENADGDGGEREYGGTLYARVCPPGEGNDEDRYFAREPLLWRVLEVRDGTALLLANAAVDCAPFQADLRDVGWESCTLRSYLNGYGASENASGVDYAAEGGSFLDMAFTEDEQAAIIDAYVRNEDNYYFGTDCGAATSDKVFVPAESELFITDSSAVHGFSPRDEVADRARQFTPTDYAVAKGAWAASDGDGQGNVFWITRTSGYTPSNVVYVDECGYMYNRGILVTCSDAAVIPALVLDLDSTAYEYAGTYTVGGRPAD